MADLVQLELLDHVDSLDNPARGVLLEEMDCLVELDLEDLEVNLVLLEKLAPLVLQVALD